MIINFLAIFSSKGAHIQRGTMSVKLDVAKRKESERKEHSTKIVNNCRKTPQSIRRWQR